MGSLNNNFTYQETNNWANRIANGLKNDYGINKGERVGIYMLNSPEYVVSILACHKTGAVQVPINKDEKGERLAYVINYSEMITLILDPEGVEFIEESSREFGKPSKHIYDRRSKKVPKEISGIRTLPFSTFDNYSSDSPGVEVTTMDARKMHVYLRERQECPKGVSRNHGG